jgi:hypothetical protein
MPMIRFQAAQRLATAQKELDTISANLSRVRAEEARLSKEKRTAEECREQAFAQLKATYEGKP